MRRRLYFLLPHVESARKTANDLLLARIEDRYMHFMVKRGTDLGELHRASYAQLSDLARGLEVGLAVGAVCGLVLGMVMYRWQAEALHLNMHLAFILATTMFGAVFGAWTGGMIGSSTPNSRLKSFAPEIEAGRILLMVDVPLGRVEEIREAILRFNPDADPRGFEPTVPAFP